MNARIEDAKAGLEGLNENLEATTPVLGFYLLVTLGAQRRPRSYGRLTETPAIDQIGTKQSDRHVHGYAGRAFSLTERQHVARFQHGRFWVVAAYSTEAAIDVAARHYAYLASPLNIQKTTVEALRDFAAARKATIITTGRNS